MAFRVIRDLRDLRDLKAPKDPPHPFKQRGATPVGAAPRGCIGQVSYDNLFLEFLDDDGGVVAAETE